MSVWLALGLGVRVGLAQTIPDNVHVSAEPVDVVDLYGSVAAAAKRPAFAQAVTTAP